MNAIDSTYMTERGEWQKHGDHASKSLAKILLFGMTRKWTSYYYVIDDMIH